MIPQTTPWAIQSCLGLADPIITYTSPDGDIWPLSGGLAPIPPLEGVAASSFKGLMAPIKHLDQQGALQDGATWDAAVYDVGEIDIDCELFANSPEAYRKIERRFIASWDPKRLGRLTWFTPDLGTWWVPLRLLNDIDATFKASPGVQGHATLTVTARVDQAFWQSFDSVCTVKSSGFITLTNTGDQSVWPRYLLYGPGTFKFQDANGPVTFGPMLPGQVVLLTSMPGWRSVLDLTPNQPTPIQQSAWQAWLGNLISFVDNNNTPPILSAIESAFGIVPPQGNIYSLLSGRFFTPVPPMSEVAGAQTWHMPVTITGGSSTTKVVAALTPFRKWPE